MFCSSKIRKFLNSRSRAKPASRLAEWALRARRKQSTAIRAAYRFVMLGRTLTRRFERWATAIAILMTARLLRYINPVTGGYTYPTMSCEVQLFKGKESTKTHRHTSTAIYHVVRGQGPHPSWRRLSWSGSRVTLSWYRSGSGMRTRISSNDEAVLFSINDRPVMDSLQLYREESTN